MTGGPGRPLTVLLPMHSTRSDNLGVGALTASQMAILRDLAADLGRPLRMIVPDFRDARAPYATGADVTHRELSRRYVLGRDGYRADLRAADVVIDIGGGDSFADIYTGKRLRLMFALKAMAHRAGKPYVLAPQTLGPFTRRWSRAAARLHLDRCALIALRDAPSMDHLRELGVARPAVLASDVALRLPPDAPPALPPADGPRVGLNVSGLLMAGGYSGANDFGIAVDYPALMTDLIALFQNAGAQVHLIPHVIVKEGPMAGEDDAAACDALAKAHPGTVRAPDFGTPSEAKAYIAAMEFFAGARMHACIAAFSTGVPVVPMAYSRKFAGLFGSLGYDRTVDCRRQDAATIRARIRAAWDDRAVVGAEARAAFARGTARLDRYVDALRDLLATL